MKKMMVILMTVIMVILASVAYGDTADEVKDFLENNRRYLKEYIVEEGENYNIVDGIAYTVGNIGERFTDMWDFMKNYEKYLKENWPEFAEVVRVDYTYAGSTENYDIICVWLDLKWYGVFSDFIESEPDTNMMSGLIYCEKVK
jgi:uncharacterized protein YozE (UPF0346 family)